MDGWKSRLFRGRDTQIMVIVAHVDEHSQIKATAPVAGRRTIEANVHWIDCYLV